MRRTIVRERDKRYQPPETALDLLEYEDRALLEIVDEFESNNDRLEHGIAGKLLTEHLAVREAARERVAEALEGLSGVTDIVDRLEEGLPARRQALGQLDELARGVRPMNLNQGQDFDSPARAIARSLQADIDVDLDQLIPALRRRIGPGNLEDILPTAGYVRHHAPTHPHPEGRRRYERFAFLVKLHALYDWVRGFPTGGAKPHREVDIPVRGE
jgi:hypothetical protein